MSFQPVAIGAAVEATKRSKPLMKRVRRDSASWSRQLRGRFRDLLPGNRCGGEVGNALDDVQAEADGQRRQDADATTAGRGLRFSRVYDSPMPLAADGPDPHRDAPVEEECARAMAEVSKLKLRHTTWMAAEDAVRRLNRLLVGWGELLPSRPGDKASEPSTPTPDIGSAGGCAATRDGWAGDDPLPRRVPALGSGTCEPVGDNTQPSVGEGRIPETAGCGKSARPVRRAAPGNGVGMNGVVPAHHRASRRLLPRPPYAVTNPSLKVAMVLVHPNCHVAGHFCPPRAMVRSLAPSRAWARSEPAPTKSVGLTTFPTVREYWIR